MVGDGSVRPERRWSRTGWDLLKHIKRHEMTEEEEGRRTMEEAAEKKVSIHICENTGREGGVCDGNGWSAVLGHFMVLITLGSQLSERFSFRPIIVGVCYLPLATGMLASRWTVGWLLDWNFGRWARNWG